MSTTTIHPKTRKERQVWQAYADLVQQGHTYDEVTVDLLMNALAKRDYPRGSRTDVNKYRKTWLAAYYAQTHLPAFSGQPEPIAPAPAAQTVLTETVQIPAATAVQAPSAILQAPSINQITLVNEHAMLLEDNAMLAKTNEQLLRENEALKSQVDTLETQLTQAQADYQTLLTDSRQERDLLYQQHQTALAQMQKAYQQMLEGREKVE